MSQLWVTQQQVVQVLLQDRERGIEQVVAAEREVGTARKALGAHNQQQEDELVGLRTLLQRQEGRVVEAREQAEVWKDKHDKVGELQGGWAAG
jgi:hypothetical protein